MLTNDEVRSIRREHRESPPRAGRAWIDSPSLRILCLNYEYPPMGGGAGNATHHTAIELGRLGHMVHVLTSRLTAQAEVETIESVTVCRVPSFRRSIHQCGIRGALSYLVFAFVKLMRLARTYDYDVYHFYFSLPTAVLALYVRLVLKKPYLISLRGSDVPGYDETSWYMGPLHTLLRPLTRYLWRHAASVTVLSRDLGRLAQRTYAPLEPVVIPNGNDSELFPRKPPEVRPGKLRLLCVCRVVDRKGLRFLIEAMKQLRGHGVELRIAGTGEAHARLARLVKEQGVEDCVSLLGYVPRARLSRCYHQADVFVLPSLSESFGQVLLEAMSSGLPIVTTSVGGIPETVHHARSGLLVPPADSDALVRAVLWLQGNPARRAHMGEYNAEHVRKRYSWPAVAAQYEALYYRVSGRGDLAESGDAALRLEHRSGLGG